MAEDRFEDKTLMKKEEEKIKQQAEETKTTSDKKTSPDTKAAKEEKVQAKQEKKRDIVLERKYVVNLASAYAKPRFKRANAAIELLAQFSARHMKSDRVRVRIDPQVNNRVRVSVRPLKRIAVLLQKDKEGTVYASLAP